MKERSLVAFTLLVQAAVGSFWVLGLLRVEAAWRTDPRTAALLTGPGFLAVVALMLAAMLTSLFHLGSPLLAWRALWNARSSWLSREIWSTVLFTGASAVWAGLLWFDRGTPLLRDVLFWVAALFGLALVLSMSWAYRLRTVPAWDCWATPVAFFTTTLLLGGQWAGLLLALRPAPLPLLAGSVPGGVAVGTLVLLSVEFLFTPLWLAGLTAGSPAAGRALTRLTRERGALFQGRLVLMLVGVGLSGALLTRLGALGASAVGALFLVILAAEVLGRVLFFEAYVREGV